MAFFCLAASAFAQTFPGGDGGGDAQSDQDARDKKDFEPAVFDSTDFINLELAPMKKDYFVGEPVILPLRLVNHTKSFVRVEASFIPVAGLKINIGPENALRRDYRGPYAAGEYAQNAVGLLPFDEFPAQVMIWSDPSMPDGLAFPEPGVYTINCSLKISVRQTRISGELRLNPFTITIHPTPKEYEPMVKTLVTLKAVKELQLRGVPADMVEPMMRLLQAYPQTTIFHPLILSSVGAQLYTQWLSDNTQTAKLNEGLRLIQIAAAINSPFKHEIGIQLMRMWDKLDLPGPGQATVKQILANMPEYYRGKIGPLPAEQGKPPLTDKEKGPLVKSMPNLEELYPPHKYWQLVE